MGGDSPWFRDSSSQVWFYLVFWRLRRRLRPRVSGAGTAAIETASAAGRGSAGPACSAAFACGRPQDAPRGQAQQSQAPRAVFTSARQYQRARGAAAVSSGAAGPASRGAETVPRRSFVSIGGIMRSGASISVRTPSFRIEAATDTLRLWLADGYRAALHHAALRDGRALPAVRLSSEHRPRRLLRRGRFLSVRLHAARLLRSDSRAGRMAACGSRACLAMRRCSPMATTSASSTTSTASSST